jgi:hypothetical protein
VRLTIKGGKRYQGPPGHHPDAFGAGPVEASA